MAAASPLARKRPSRPVVASNRPTRPRRVPTPSRRRAAAEAPTPADPSELACVWLRGFPRRASSEVVARLSSESLAPERFDLSGSEAILEFRSADSAARATELSASSALVGGDLIAVQISRAHAREIEAGWGTRGELEASQLRGQPPPWSGRSPSVPTRGPVAAGAPEPLALEVRKPSPPLARLPPEVEDNPAGAINAFLQARGLLEPGRSPLSVEFDRDEARPEQQWRCRVAVDLGSHTVRATGGFFANKPAAKRDALLLAYRRAFLGESGGDEAPLGEAKNGKEELLEPPAKRARSLRTSSSGSSGTSAAPALERQSSHDLRVTPDRASRVAAASFAAAAAASADSAAPTSSPAAAVTDGGHLFDAANGVEMHVKHPKNELLEMAAQRSLSQPTFADVKVDTPQGTRFRVSVEFAVPPRLVGAQPVTLNAVSRERIAKHEAQREAAMQLLATMSASQDIDEALRARAAAFVSSVGAASPALSPTPQPLVSLPSAPMLSVPPRLVYGEPWPVAGERGEDVHIEFKGAHVRGRILRLDQVVAAADTIIKYAVSFVNYLSFPFRRSSCRIVYGVHDDGSVFGVDLGDEPPHKARDAVFLALVSARRAKVQSLPPDWCEFASTRVEFWSLEGAPHGRALYVLVVDVAVTRPAVAVFENVPYVRDGPSTTRVLSFHWLVDRIRRVDAWREPSTAV